MSEIKLHSDCFLWAWNAHPETRLLLCYNLNNSKNKIDGNINRSLGLIKGRSDMTFYWRRSAYFFEFKTESGFQSADQKAFQNKVESQGFEYYIIRDLQTFKDILTKIINL